MKTNKLFIAMLTVVAVLFTACKEEFVRETSPTDANAGCYIFDNMSDMTIFPDATGTKYLRSMIGSEDTVLIVEKEIDLLIGRSLVDTEESFELQVEVLNDKYKSKFTFDPKVHFAKGENIDTVTITVGLDFGESTALTITIPEEKASAYSAFQKTINVAVDYTWLPRGKAEVTDGSIFGVTTTVAVEKAKEYVSSGNDSLFRLTNVFEELAKTVAPEEYAIFSTPNVHFKFVLDKEWKLVALKGNGGNIDPDNFSTTGYSAADLYGVNWSGEVEYNYTLADSTNYKPDRTDGEELAIGIKQDQNVYQYQWYAYVGMKPYYTIVDLAWIWTDGFPGEITSPSEGEGVVNLELTSGKYNFTQADKDKKTPGKYNLELTTSTGATMYLELIGDTLENDYSIKDVAEAVGDAQAGAYKENKPNGCYIDAAFTKYYLTAGEIKINKLEKEKFEIAIEATTPSEVEIFASDTITVTSRPASVVLPKNNFRVQRINL